jgi:hypothetical protein
VFTRRIFDGVLLTILAAHVAFALPRMWARTELAGNDSSKLQRLAAGTIIRATW